MNSVQPRYAPFPEWEKISGMKRTQTYEKAAEGSIRIVKLGKKSLVDVDHGLAYMASLPAADIRTGKDRPDPEQNAA
jgi:hypothetical protein